MEMGLRTIDKSGLHPNRFNDSNQKLNKQGGLLDKGYVLVRAFHEKP